MAKMVDRYQSQARKQPGPILVYALEPLEFLLDIRGAGELLLRNYSVDRFGDRVAEMVPPHRSVG